MKKVLILTLGGGRASKLIEGQNYYQLNDEQKIQLIKERLKVVDDFGYQPIEYRFADTCEETGYKTEFVAEVLIRKEAPDYVFIIGTTRSAWVDFYRKYTEDEAPNRAEDVCSLLNISESLRIGDDVEIEKLLRDAEIIGDILMHGLRRTLFVNCPQNCIVRPILLRYGLNDDQLKENYEILAKAWQLLEKDETYDVSFDITHSFRSLPIYNLSLLDYQRQIANYNITISHVYYGNAEISREKGYASIVDLVDLVNVMDLSRGVSEFRELGYSMTLVRQIPENMRMLRESLERFYWAVQMNDTLGIGNSIGNIIGELNRVGADSGRYVDLKQMILDGLREILGDEPERFTKVTTAQQGYTLTFLLAKWHLGKRRYSSAVVAAQESFTVFLTGLYLEERLNRPKDSFQYPDDYEDAVKKEAVAQFVQQFKKGIEGTFKDLHGIFLNIRSFRNNASHPSVKENVDSIREDVERFIRLLEILYGLQDQELDSFLKAYRLKKAIVTQPVFEPSEAVSDTNRAQSHAPLNKTAYEGVSTSVEREVNNLQETLPKETEHEKSTGATRWPWSIGLYIGKRKKNELVGILQLDKDFKMYQLDPDVYQCLFSGIEGSPAKWAVRARALFRYLENMGLDLQKAYVYLDIAPETSFFVAQVLAFSRVYHVFYLGSQGFRKIPMRDVKKKKSNEQVMIEKAPNIGVYSITFDSWQRDDVEKMVNKITEIGLKIWD